ncbi:MAG: hypothetical protein OHK0048_11320 [Rhodoferax sp.]
MILINLLPHREMARKRRKEQFTLGLGMAALMGGLVAGGIYGFYLSKIGAQEAKNQQLKSEITRFEAQIKDIANLESEIEALRARQQAVEDLQADRNMPVHLLNELVRQLPEGTYIASLKQEGQTVTIKGAAQSNERVSEFLRNLGSRSPWFSRPELIEIVAGSVTLAPRDIRRVYNYTISVKLLRASEVEKARSASAPASAPAPHNAASGAVVPKV